MRQSKKSIFSLCVSVINSACSVLIFEIHTCVSKDGFRFSETLTFLTSSKIRKISGQKYNYVTKLCYFSNASKKFLTHSPTVAVLYPPS